MTDDQQSIEHEIKPPSNAKLPLHQVLKVEIDQVPDGHEVAFFAMGCFWGSEKKFWEQHGVYSTAVGYAGGHTINPEYEQVCAGSTGHAETVKVVYDPQLTTYAQLLALFWHGHDPTQGLRQGMDVGSQYRSAIFTVNNDQLRQAKASQKEQQLKHKNTITTEIKPIGNFFYGENYHQQYLAKRAMSWL